MRLNKKGFMMAEVVVVSAVVLIFLATIYVSYNQIYSKYKSKVSYYDAVALYQLSYFRDALIENKQLVSALDTAKVNKVVEIYNSNNAGDNSFQLSGDDSTKQRAFILYNNKDNLNGSELDDISGINETYKDYIKYLSTSVDLKDIDYVMVIEQCNNNKENCKYAYLDLYNGGQVANSTQSPSTAPSTSSNNNGSPSVTNGGVCYILNAVKYDACNGQTVTVSSCEGKLSEYNYKCPNPNNYNARYRAICTGRCSYQCNGDTLYFTYSQLKMVDFCK